MMNNLKLTTLLLLIFFAFNAKAILPFEDATYPELITSARALGMGNAYISKVDDSTAAFYNPAGLGTVRGTHFHLTNIHIEANKGLNDLISSTGAFNTPGNLLTSFSAEGIDSLLANQDKILVHSRINLFPSLTFRYFSLGYLYSSRARARLTCATCNREFAERTDSGPVAALNVSFFGGILKFGASAAVLKREEFQKDFATGNPYFVGTNEVQTGTQVLLTTGMRLTLPVSYLLTFSAVLRNSANSTWYDTGLGGAPAEIPQTIDGSISITPQIGRNTRVHLEAVLRDMTNGYDTVDAARKFGAGMEFDFVRKYFIRFGYGDGWGSFGLGVRNSSSVFDLATYAHEVGANGGFREEEDRRFVFSWAMGF